MRLETTTGGDATQFPATRWSLVCDVQRDPERGRQALEELARSYWKPLYALARRKGARIEDAKDAVQGFFVHVIEHDVLARPDPEKGRFRSFLRACFNNYLANQEELRSAKKRGGGVRTLSLDVETAERDLAALPADPEAAYEREWATGVMERGLRRLEADLGPSGVFAAVRGFFSADSRVSYEEAARTHGMSVPQLKSCLHRARKRFRALVLELVAETVLPRGDTEAELDALLRALRP